MNFTLNIRTTVDWATSDKIIVAECSDQTGNKECQQTNFNHNSELNTLIRVYIYTNKSQRFSEETAPYQVNLLPGPSKQPSPITVAAVNSSTIDLPVHICKQLPWYLRHQSPHLQTHLTISWHCQTPHRLEYLLG